MAGYSGLGSLASWVRVIAVREYYARAKSRKSWKQMDDEELIRVASEDADPELGVILRRFRSECQAALDQAVGSLTARQRNVLRLRYLDGLKVNQIAKICGVHRVTVSEWISEAKKEVLARTRQALIDQLQVGRSQTDSILRLMRSQIDLSIRTCLGSITAEEEPAKG